MSKQSNFYSEMVNTAHNGGLPYLSKWDGEGYRLEVGPMGPMDTTVLIEQRVGKSYRISHAAFATTDGKTYRPLTLKQAKYIIESLAKDMLK